MAKVYGISGTPWHVERVHNEDENDSRRHRTRCMYYDKETKHCKRQYGMCVGASQCNVYREKTEDLIIDQDTGDGSTVKEGNNPKSEVSGINYIGQQVIHTTFGQGEIIAQDRENRIQVCFSDGAVKEFSAPKCFGSYLFLTDPAAIIASTLHIADQLKKENAEKEIRRREMWEKTLNKAAERRKESGRNREMRVKSFSTISAFFDAQNENLEAEAGYLRATGGRKHRLSDGELISVSGDRYIYSFESDMELSLPDNMSITLWKGNQSFTATLMYCEEFTLYIAVTSFLGNTVPEMEFSSEPWKLIYDLKERLDVIRTNPSGIIKSLILEGRKKVDFSGMVQKGQDKALSLSWKLPILFLWGPPGTGKTETLANIVHNHVNAGEKVLMLSHSNVSVDEAALRVLGKDGTKEPGKLVRYGYPRKKDVLEHPYLSSYNLCLSQHPDLNRKRQALIDERKHLIRNSSRYLQTGKELNALRDQLKQEEKLTVQGAQFVATTVSKAIADKTLYEARCDTVIFDEASMATIPQIIFAASLAKEHFVCIGDFAQLPPIVQSDKASDLNADIFQYCGIMDAIESGYGHEWLCMLHVQYRMHPDIASFVSKRMYHDLLQNGSEMNIKRAAIVAAAPFQNESLVLADLSGMMSVCTKTKDQSRVNVLSALLSMGIAIRAARDHEVGIITPYNAQSRLLHAMSRDLMERGTLNQKIVCATVHQFQGSEKDMIVYDAVDCYRMPYPGMMISSEQNQYANRLFNVAMTRAKGKMISLVNAEYMQNKKLSGSLLFRQLMDMLSVQSHRGKQILQGVDQTEINIVMDHSLDNQFLSDLCNAKNEVRIDIPGRIDMDQAMTQKLIDVLQALIRSGKTVVIRAEHKQDLPTGLRSMAIENEYVANPVILIDKQISWFGQPASGACFITEGKMLQTLYRPVIRFAGKHFAKALYSILEMNSKIDMDGQKNEQGTYDTFGAYVRGEMKCENCGKPMTLRKGSVKFYLACADYPRCENRKWIDPGMVDDYLYFGNKKGRFCQEDGTSLKAGQGKKNVYVGCQCGGKRHFWRLDEI